MSVALGFQPFKYLATLIMAYIFKRVAMRVKWFFFAPEKPHWCILGHRA